MTERRLTTRSIRYYHRHLDPADFSIRVRILNWIRWKLELVVQRMVVKELFLRSPPQTGAGRKLERLLNQFDDDVEYEEHGGVDYERTATPESLGESQRVVTAARRIPMTRTPRNPDPPNVQLSQQMEATFTKPKTIEALVEVYARKNNRVQTHVTINEDFESVRAGMPSDTQDVPQSAVIGEFSLKEKV